MNELSNLSDFLKTFIYVVQNGDDLNSVAEKFHTTSFLIIELNGLTEDITCGDVLLIEKVEGKEYTVQPKDTLLSICGGDERKIIALTAKNRVDEVFVGQKIYI